MTDLSLPNQPSHDARHADSAWLALALAQTRARSLAMLQGWRAQNGDALGVAYDPTFNPMRWEFGHIGWFETWWLARNRERHRGVAANPLAERAPAAQPQADNWYNSTTVEHRSRWSLVLPSIDAILDDVSKQREVTLALLKDTPDNDSDLYFFRLALMHEDMHNEAWAMMAQALGIHPGDDFSRRALRSLPRHEALSIPQSQIDLAGPAVGFAFDNEQRASTIDVPAFCIDATPVTWDRYLPFVEAGGYHQQVWWTNEGWAWRQARAALHPRYLAPRGAKGTWQQRHFERWIDVDPAAAASHLSCHEAQAWCRWSGRALPSEAQWRAAQASNGRFVWGDVWEWTSTAFAPFDGFEPHPYREYSQPWFDGRPVLKGASALTNPHMAHVGYRNFFEPQRDDVMAGFRSCASPSALKG